MKVGDEAPHAHQNIREFPAWYKPYSFNYDGDGYMLLFFGVFALFGYSYLNDIKEQKGRTYRKTFASSLRTESEYNSDFFAVNRINAGDESYKKYLKPKERAHVHHWEREADSHLLLIIGQTHLFKLIHKKFFNSD